VTPRKFSGSVGVGAVEDHDVPSVERRIVPALPTATKAPLPNATLFRFCVPLVEAFYKQVPVLAYAATAVPDTMDGAGVLYTTQEPLEVAALIDAVVDDTQLYDRIVASQEQALQRLRAKDFDGTLLGYIDQVLKSPRKPMPPVAWDFWDQVRLAEELFELQQYRPAVFRGLPESPESKTGLVEEKR